METMRATSERLFMIYLPIWSFVSVPNLTRVRAVAAPTPFPDLQS
jgi:hypothetical protein